MPSITSYTTNRDMTLRHANPIACYVVLQRAGRGWEGTVRRHQRGGSWRLSGQRTRPREAFNKTTDRNGCRGLHGASAEQS